MKQYRSGKVYLAGAGPGDPGLVTLRTAELLHDADVVIYDSLVNPDILQLAPQAEKKLVRKSPEKMSSDRQQEIYRLLERYAGQGKQIVRLKGGDPFVFGRGGEEAEFLQGKKIPFEIVPGVSAGHAVPAYAGIPVTDRRCASSVVFVTAYEEPNKAALVNWKVLAQISGTLVIFMGVKTLDAVARALIRFGKSGKTPVTITQWGTLPEQKTVEGTLATIAGIAKKNKIESPAIAVVGEVNRFRKKLSWVEKKPLWGKRVMITRASSQAGSLKSLLENLGARVIESAAIRIEPPEDWLPLDRALENLNKFDWILFTSINAVKYFFQRLTNLGKDLRSLGGIKIAAIGESTQEELCCRGICADLVPKSYTSQALVEKLNSEGLIWGRRFLLPRTDIAPEFLSQVLRDSGGEVTDVVAYRTISAVTSQDARALRRHLIGKEAADFITFTSASTVDHVFKLIPKKDWKKIRARIISIGPVTSQTLKSYGARPFREAKEHTISGLVKVLIS